MKATLLRLLRRRVKRNVRIRYIYGRYYIYNSRTGKYIDDGYEYEYIRNANHFKSPEDALPTLKRARWNEMRELINEGMFSPVAWCINQRLRKL